MKVMLTRDVNRVTIHFSCELPILIPTFQPHEWALPYPWLLSRATSLAGFADRLCRVNAGKFSVELSSPGQSFRDFVEELVVVPGLVQVLDSDRYSLTIETGECFSTATVCQAVADCVTRHFHPTETAIVEGEPECELFHMDHPEATRPTKPNRLA